jgi:hypothetical protein
LIACSGGLEEIILVEVDEENKLNIRDRKVVSF